MSCHSQAVLGCQTLPSLLCDLRSLSLRPCHRYQGIHDVRTVPTYHKSSDVVRANFIGTTHLGSPGSSGPCLTDFSSFSLIARWALPAFVTLVSLHALKCAYEKNNLTTPHNKSIMWGWTTHPCQKAKILAVAVILFVKCYIHACKDLYKDFSLETHIFSS